MRNILHYLCTCLYLTCFLAQVSAQQIGFDNITIDDGLMHNNVNSIVQDQQGFMWFGTRDGLCRYDGYDFRFYPIKDTSGTQIADQRIQKLFADNEGDIWVMPTRGGLLIFDHETQEFESEPIEPPMPNWDDIVVQSVFRDSRGNYWIGTTDNGVIQLDSNLTNSIFFATNSSDLNRRITGEHCYSFAEDGLGRVWFGVSGLYVNRFDPKRDTIDIIRRPDADDDESYSYRRSLASTDSLIWVGTEGKGVRAYNIMDGAFKMEVLNDVFVRDVAVSPNGELLVATDGNGLFRQIGSTTQFRNFKFDPNHVKSLSTNALYDLFIDREENIWIGTYNGGVNFLTQQQAAFATFTLPRISGQSTGANSVISFAKGETDDELWVGIDGGGIWKLSIEDESLTPIEDILPSAKLSSNVITTLYFDGAHSLWAGTFLNGLNRIDLRTGETEVFRADQFQSSGLQNNNIWDIARDNSGQVWLATLGGGLHVLTPETREFRQYPRGSGLSDRNARTLFIDREDNIWIGTERGGLNKLLPNRKTFISWRSNLDKPDGLQSNFVQCILEDSKGRIWVGTEGGGLHRLNEKEDGFYHFGVDEGLPSNIICSLEEDAYGSIWVGTSKGLAYLDPATTKIIRYDQRDGLLSNQFNPNASVRIKDGPIVFGNIKGINAVYPGRINIDTSFPDVVFTDFKIFDKSIPVGKVNDRVVLNKPLNEDPVVTLAYADNAFTISFAALAYSSQLKVQYAYRMVGFNENWITVNTKGRDATYTNLDPGDYTFEVKASNVYGEWPDNHHRLVITVAPPFWDTWWFKVLASIFIFTSLALALRYVDVIRREENKRKLAQAEQEILRLKNQQLEKEVQTKNSRLSAALLQSAHKNKALSNLGDQLKELAISEEQRSAREIELKKLVRKISSEVDSIDYWEQFQLNFDAVHQDFSHKLYSRHPKLTTNDLRLCSLIRINLTNAEIGSIQNISKSGVEKSKYRLKQKLGLSSEEDLNSYILTLN